MSDEKQSKASATEACGKPAPSGTKVYEDYIATLKIYVENAIKAAEADGKAGASYTTAILGGFYAALFAIWTYVKADLSPIASASVGALALVSVSLFALWELCVMLSRAWSATTLPLEENISIEVLHAKVLAWQHAQIRRAARFRRIWIFLLVPTVAAAIGAVGVMATALVTKIAGPLWAHFCAT